MLKSSLSSKALVSVLLLVLATFCWTGWADKSLDAVGFSKLDQHAEGYLSGLRNRALLSYGVARAVNQVVSIAQSAEVGAVVASINPGELLDPINDLVERFSSIILICVLSIGILEILLVVGGETGVSMAVALALLLFAAVMWLPKNGLRKRITALAMGILIFGLFMKLYAPMVALVGDQLSKQFFEEEQQEVMAQVREIGNAISVSGIDEEIPPAGIETPDNASMAPNDEGEVGAEGEVESEPGFWQRLLKSNGPYGAGGDQSGGNSGGWGRMKLPDVSALVQRLEPLRDNIFVLLKQFLFETIILPLIAGLALFWTIRSLVRQTRDD